MNPGGSVKDRAAKYILEDAMSKGLIRSGGTVVEGTAGNTGIGLALVGNALGLKTVIVIPETQSEEKKATIRACGAELIEVPAVPYKDENNYVKYSKRVAESLENPNGVLSLMLWVLMQHALELGLVDLKIYHHQNISGVITEC